MVEQSPSPELSLQPDGGPAESDLAALPGPPRQARTWSLVLMALTAVVATFMTFVLLRDVRYAFGSAEAEDLGDLRHVSPSPAIANRFVRGNGLLGSAGAIRYDRPLESDAFRLAPLVGNDRIWIEMRVPPEAEVGPGVPQTSFVGRLVPIKGGGFRHSALRKSVRDATGVVIATDAWVLVDGATPSSFRWTVPLCALFAVFAIWNLVAIARILRPAPR
jgi:hypothetical protein